MLPYREKKERESGRELCCMPNSVVEFGLCKSPGEDLALFTYTCGELWLPYLGLTPPNRLLCWWAIVPTSAGVVGTENTGELQLPHRSSMGSSDKSENPSFGLTILLGEIGRGFLSKECKNSFLFKEKLFVNGNKWKISNVCKIDTLHLPMFYILLKANPKHDIILWGSISIHR